MARDLKPVFERLKAILEPYGTKLTVVHDSDDQYYLDTSHIMKNGKPLYFGSAIIKKNYVSFYLMPVYVEPTLLEGISDDLKKRMQGKSCFNFTEVDEPLFAELAELTNRGFHAYHAAGYVGGNDQPRAPAHRLPTATTGGASGHPAVLQSVRPQ